VNVGGAVGFGLGQEKDCQQKKESFDHLSVINNKQQ
jgi:hypothetical protein